MPHAKTLMTRTLIIADLSRNRKRPRVEKTKIHLYNVFKHSVGVVNLPEGSFIGDALRPETSTLTDEEFAVRIREKELVGVYVWRWEVEPC